MWGWVRLFLLQRLSDLNIVLTEEMVNELVRAGYKRSRVARMENGIDASFFRL